jgi:rhamnogalacturonyl hydrolase YesR
MYYSRLVTSVLAGCVLVLPAGCSHWFGESSSCAFLRHPDFELSQAVLRTATPTNRLTGVADRVRADFSTPPPFDWGEGVMMAGMVRAGVTLESPRHVTFVQTWADYWRAYGLRRVLDGEGERLQGYCGHWGPGLAVIMLYEQTKDPVYLEMAREVAAFIEKDATRLKDGGLGHWKGNYQLWVDTLYMACPVLARLSKIDNRPELMDDAVRQLEIYAKRLQDEKTGLFYHMYDEPTDKHTEVLWARGNGWTVMSYVEVLKLLDRSSPAWQKLQADFKRQVAGLLATQDPQTGLWHTVLDRPESYIETSASAMFIYALAEAYRLGLLDQSREFNKAVVHGWLGLVGKVDRDGRVYDVSGGTGPTGYKDYAEKIRGTYTWGTGAYLLATSELTR